MKYLFKELFEYNHHYNQKLAELFLRESDRTTGRSGTLFSHLLNAHHTWNSRILSMPGSYGIWEELPFTQLMEIDSNNFQSSLQILQQKELDEAIRYKTSKGEAYSNSVRDILFHIINHSTYHRGQIASDFRVNGIEPVVSDYIFYKRRT